MGSLFYADVLGMKARWRTGDIAAVKATYRAFEALVETTLADRGSNPAAGGVQSDAVALVFTETLDAIEFGRTLFQRTFDAASASSRVWLRGLICPCDGHELVKQQPLGSHPTLFARHFSDDLLQAVNIEQQFRGPRLLVARSLVDQQIKDHLAIPIEGMHVVPLRRLDHVPYPAGEWWDVLYLLPEAVSSQALEPRDAQMSRVVRWAISSAHGGSREEFEQVAVLSVTWTETRAIAHHVARTARKKRNNERRRQRSRSPVA